MPTRGTISGFRGLPIHNQVVSALYKPSLLHYISYVLQMKILTLPDSLWAKIFMGIGIRKTIWMKSIKVQIDPTKLFIQTSPKESAYNAGARFDPWVRKISWRRKWQSTPVFLPGEFHGQRSLVGYSPWGHKESDTTKWLTHTHTEQRKASNLCRRPYIQRPFHNLH